MTDLAAELQNYTAFFNNAISAYFVQPTTADKRVIEAMHYAVAGGGKRLRPFLVAASAALFGISKEQSLPTAMALECLHTYSLIHDDLPAMDNDDLRRGRPTCHRQFDEATAILAGDGLLTYAFEIISSIQKTAAETKVELVALLAKAAGAFGGMVAGQMLDLSFFGSIRNQEAETIIKQIEAMKTGRLLSFACEAGAVLGQAQAAERQALLDYSRGIGIAFQITDDILDVEGNPKLVGKTLGKDAAQEKLTFVSLYGLEPARKIAADLIGQAKQPLAIFGAKADLLCQLADFILNRKK